VIDSSSSDPVFGKVMLCLLAENGVCSLVVTVCKSSQFQGLGIHRIQDVKKDLFFKCVLMDELWDYNPLSDML